MNMLPPINIQHYVSNEYLSKERFSSYCAILKMVLKHNYQSIADIGKGSGIMAALLTNFNIPVTTIDYADNLNPDIICDVRNLNQLKEQFDCVLCCQVLEHIPFDDFDKAVKSLIAISKKAVIITIPDRRYYLETSFKIPGFNQKNVQINLPFPIKRWNANKNPEHLWEMNQKPYTESAVCQLIDATCARNNYQLAEHKRIDGNPTHHYFYLKSKKE